MIHAAASPSTSQVSCCRHKFSPAVIGRKHPELLERCRALDEDCEGLVNYILGMEGIEVALFFRELADGRWRVSLRSKGAIDVAAIAARLPQRVPA